jgi:hypothetical protein
MPAKGGNSNLTQFGYLFPITVNVNEFDDLALKIIFLS